MFDVKWRFMEVAFLIAEAFYYSYFAASHLDLTVAWYTAFVFSQFSFSGHSYIVLQLQNSWECLLVY